MRKKSEKNKTAEKKIVEFFVKHRQVEIGVKELCKKLDVKRMTLWRTVTALEVNSGFEKDGKEWTFEVIRKRNKENGDLTNIYKCEPVEELKSGADIIEEEKEKEKNEYMMKPTKKKKVTGICTKCGRPFTKVKQYGNCSFCYECQKKRKIKI